MSTHVQYPNTRVTNNINEAVAITDLVKHALTISFGKIDNYEIISEMVIV